MIDFTRKLTLAAAGISLCVVPIGAFAASPAPVTPPPAAAAQTVNPWLALSAMTTSSSSIAAAASATASTQGDPYDAPSPWPAWVVIGLTVALMVYIAAKGDSNKHFDFQEPPPVSPA